ncbi:Oligogalacturonate-specific porin KdgM [Mixta theicola]|nr:oligogalacturonate-specific porin KdgM family protein [Mixta theicola]QHM76499.1 Oligogalacturonate-specific porin KdgM [Mixta theicola]
MNIKLLAACSLLFVTGFSHAVTLDYRHEYTDDDKQNKDRFLVTHRFANGLGFGLEAMWKNGGSHKSKMYNDVVGNGTEVTLSYQQAITPKWNLQPNFVVQSGNSHTGYKPGLYTNYKVTDNFTAAARYRWEYIRNTANGAEDDKVNRADIWLAYKIDKIVLEYNYFYIHSANKLRYDNKKWDYEHSVKAQYNINKEWGPYIAMLNKSVKPTSDERQTGFRFGIQYRF